MASRSLATRSPACHCLHRPIQKQLDLLFSSQGRTFTTTISPSANKTFAAVKSRKRKTRSYLKPSTLDPNKVYRPKFEKLLVKHQHITPVGSRRRRAIQARNENLLPFEQLPYQCFQEARKVLAADREEKLNQIAEMRERIGKAMEKPADAMGGEYVKKGKLVRMQKWLEHLKILADINDPMIRKRFEDGMGDMNRPIYRYLAERKWHDYHRKMILQRISQFHLVPDLLPHLNPTADVSLGYGRRKIPPGEILDSRMSEFPPSLRVQVFDKGTRLVTIAVIDPDVPDTEHDSFSTRCHFLAVNIPIAPDAPSVPLRALNPAKHIVLPWLPPYSQKGAPYHRLAIVVLQQQPRNSDGGQEPEKLDLDQLKATKLGSERDYDRWNLQTLITTHRLEPVGVTLFRTVWDEGADAVARRAGWFYKDEVVGTELVRKKPEKNIYKKKDGARFR